VWQQLKAQPPRRAQTSTVPPVCDTTWKVPSALSVLTSPPVYRVVAGPAGVDVEEEAAREHVAVPGMWARRRWRMVMG
jgi:hypothetical protein